ncbi:MAG: response regulator transcription factor [Bryobacterales bacterium]|nr:response regulator transcription factor [Bryobacterales bacterium]
MSAQSGFSVVPAAAPASVLVAEPEPLIAEALAALCTAGGRFHPVAVVTSGEQAMAAVLRSAPEVAIASLDLPGLHTLELIGRALSAGIRTRFVVLSARTDRKTVLECLRAGAKGFVLRSCTAADFFYALEQVRNGGVYLAPQVHVGQIFTESDPSLPGDPIEQLSSREYQVFTMLVDGIRAKEIAARLDLSPKTVDTYRASLMRKLDIHDVAGLVKFAIRRSAAQAAGS